MFSSLVLCASCTFTGARKIHYYYYYNILIQNMVLIITESEELDLSLAATTSPAVARLQPPGTQWSLSYPHATAQRDSDTDRASVPTPGLHMSYVLLLS